MRDYSKATNKNGIIGSKGALLISRLLATSALLLSISGCVVPTNEVNEGNSQSEKERAGEPPGQASHAPDRTEPFASSITTSTELGQELQIDIQSLSRLENGIIKLDFDVTNDSTQEYIMSTAFAAEGERYTPGAITLIDAGNSQRLLSLKQSNGKCLCKTFEGFLGAGETESSWVAFPEPQDGTSKLTVITPITPPIFDVPIADSTETLESANTSDEEILDLIMISEDTEDQTGRTESNEEVSILLSSDVLFATNSSNLDSDSQEILEQVAQEIDDASATVVSVDGHTDDTGNDSINIPLSKERAKSVENALANLVTREDVNFETEGHGSTEPIAENSTDEGRERNRRVSVTFEK